MVLKLSKISGNANAGDVYIGLWCASYIDESQWENIKQTVVEDNDAFYKGIDVAYLYRVALASLAIELNKVHGESYSERVWEIIVGHWLQRFVNLCVCRAGILLSAFEDSRADSVECYSNPSHDLACYDSEKFIWASSTVEWNQVFFSSAYRLLKSSAVSIEVNPCVIEPVWQKRTIKQFGYMKAVTDRFLRIFHRNSGPYISNSYLPKVTQALLNLTYFQPPRYINPNYNGCSQIDMSLRNSIAINDLPESLEGRLIKYLMPSAIPISYIENYGAIKKWAKLVGLPSRPSFIFTSNNFDADELFKVYTGKMVNSGSKYYCGQHGGAYGTCADTYDRVEVRTPDKFITWGWKGETKNIYKGFVFKKIKKIKNNQNGGILLTLIHPPHLVGPTNDRFAFDRYLEGVFEFLSSLDKRIMKCLTVRFHGSSRQFESELFGRFMQKFPKISYDYGTEKIENQLANYRIQIMTYDSTGILESYVRNLPCIGFWRNLKGDLLDGVRDDYDLLEKASLLFDNPTECAAHINSIWDMVPEWWEAKQTSAAVKAHTMKYAVTKSRKISVVRKILNDQKQF